MKRIVLAFLSILFVPALVLFTHHSVKGASEYVGSEACKDCHEAYYNKFMKSIHGKKAIPGAPINREGCESCHGPGAQHVEKGGGRGVAIFVFGRKTEPMDRDSKCLACHEDSNVLAFWNMNRHKFAGNSCDSCHSIHSATEKKDFLKAPEPALCFNCHKNIRSQVNKQSHHPLNEEFVGRQAVKCSSCHNVMGSFGASPVDSFSTRIGTGTDKMLRADSVNELCFKCHAEKRGPFMWEHPPVEENCLICHEAHGSNHRKLLVSKVQLLCQNCHSNEVLHPSRPYTNLHSFTGPATSGKNKFFGRSCLNCHANIHGSNGPGARGQAFLR
jgi:DmsE family decaheme c-type cytochrome